MTRITVGLLTFRRPDDLRDTLPLVREQVEAINKKEDVEANLLVIDNDPERSAKPLVEQVGGAVTRYVAEPVPGISAGRNRAIDESGRSDLLVFIDDDERPGVAWLQTLFDMWRRERSTAVVGRVVSELPSDLDPWVIAGRFFIRPVRPTGMMMSTAATNNLLLDLNHVRRHELRFDLSLGLSGGEDNLFSRQLIASGGTIVFTNEAVVTDVVPVERTSRRFLLRRAWSHGNTTAVVDVRLAHRRDRLLTRIRLLAKGLVRVVGGAVRAVGGIAIRSPRHNARGLRAVYRGCGMMVGALGVVYQEYARTRSTEIVDSGRPAGRSGDDR